MRSLRTCYKQVSFVTSIKLFNVLKKTEEENRESFINGIGISGRQHEGRANRERLVSAIGGAEREDRDSL